MKSIIFYLILSLCFRAEAQKNFSLLTRAGTIAEIYKTPNYSKNGRKEFDDKSYSTFGMSIYLEQKKILLQVNIDTKIVTFRGIPKWFPSYTKADFPQQSPNVIGMVGDTVSLYYNYSNWLNMLYNFTPLSNRHHFFGGVGLTGRLDNVSYISYIENPLSAWPVLVDGYKKYRIAPTLRIEYFYYPFKWMFASANFNYSLFMLKPNHYLQLGLGVGFKIPLNLHK